MYSNKYVFHVSYSTGEIQEDNIDLIANHGEYTVTAANKIIKIWKRGKLVCLKEIYIIIVFDKLTSFTHSFSRQNTFATYVNAFINLALLIWYLTY